MQCEMPVKYLMDILGRQLDIGDHGSVQPKAM